MDKITRHKEIIERHKDLLSQTKGAETTSSRYKAISTLDVLRHFEERGFTVSRFYKVSSTKEERQGYEKHEVRLDLPESLDFKIDGLKPKLHIINSFDASSSLKFYLGCYRLVCSNGLIIGRGLFNERIVHVGDTEHKLNQSLDRAKTAIDLVSNQIKDWSSLVLSPEQVNDLAIRLVQLRLPKNTEKRQYQIDIRSIRQAVFSRREDDNSNDLFTVFNRIQENVLERPIVQYRLLSADDNGYKTVSRRRLNRLSPIKSTGVNSQFWTETAEFYNELKEGA